MYLKQAFNRNKMAAMDLSDRQLGLAVAIMSKCGHFGNKNKVNLDVEHNERCYKLESKVKELFKKN